MKLETTQSRDQPRGFTLIECLYVVLILGILASIIAPAFRTVITDSQPVKESVLINAVEKAKTRAVLAGTATSGNVGIYSEFSAFLQIKGATPTLTQIASGATNGTGKNIYTWGRYTTPSQPVRLGTSAAVTQ